MATVERDLFEEQREELMRKAGRLMRTATTALRDLQEVMDELSGAPSREPRVDANGEPMWVFAVKQNIPTDIYLTRAFKAYASEYEFTEGQADILFNGSDTYEGFKRYYVRAAAQKLKNGKWVNWTMVWQKWVRTSHERRQEQARRKNSGRETRFDQQRTRS